MANQVKTSPARSTLQKWYGVLALGFSLATWAVDMP